MKPQLIRVAAALIVVASTGCAGNPLPSQSAPVPASPSTRWTKSGQLLYAATIEGHAFVFSYPHGGIVGTFTIGTGDQVWGACADSNGNVYFTVEQNATSSLIEEYAHGGTTPIATLHDDGYVASDCSSDPLTGDLAVTSYDQGTNGSNNVAIYRHARGTPKRYFDSQMSVAFCGYDGSGNLFVDGSGSYQLAELAKGSAALTNFSLSPPLVRPGGVEWDGTNLAIEDSGFARRFAAIDRVQISRSGASILGTTHLKGLANRGVTFWISGGDVVTTAGQQDTLIGRWQYPAGGKPVKIFRAHGIRGEELYAVAISAAPNAP
ncbi:MAG: hypothetical protein WB609_06095 [Candidatus Cybelea sp.]